MKKINYFYLLILSIFSVCCITACGSDDDDPLTPGGTTPKGLSASLSKSSLNFECGVSWGSDHTSPVPQKITVTATGYTNFGWDIDNDNMCFIDELSSHFQPETFEITVVCRSNESFEERKATLTIFAIDDKGNKKTDTCLITQEGRPNIIPVQKGYLIDNTGGTLDIGFKSNSEYTCTIEDDAKSWVHEANSSTRGYSEKVRRFTIDASNTSRREGHITFKSGFVEETISITQTSNIANGHEYVDLGLPSGTKWATCNVGATVFYEYGEYYAWGETEPKNKYTEENYKYAKYNNGKDADGFQVKDPFYEYENLGEDISGTQYDVAHVKWGDNWSMPTYDQVVELQQYTKKQYATINGVSGYKIISKESDNNNWIFMPCAGFASDEHTGGHFFDYWTSTPWWPGVNDKKAYEFYSVDEKPDKKFGERWRGFSVRPVIK